MSFNNQNRSKIYETFQKTHTRKWIKIVFLVLNIKESITTMYIQNMKPVHSALYSRNVQDNINNSTRNKLWYWITGKHTER